MTQLCFVGIPEKVAADVRTTMRSPQYGHPAHRETASGTGPCRLCLRTFVIGRDERILFTYQPFQDPGSLPAPGPVFIHAHACARYEATEMPPDFRTLPLILEAYGDSGKLIAQERVGTEVVEESLRRLFEAGTTRYVHIRNGEAGCFMARVERRSDLQ